MEVNLCKLTCTELSLFGVRGLEFTGDRVGDGKHEHVHLVQPHVLL